MKTEQEYSKMCLLIVYGFMYACGIHRGPYEAILGIQLQKTALHNKYIIKKNLQGPITHGK